MEIEKPVVFISHVSTDKPIANILKSEIDRVFANGVHVFASSVPGVLRPGADWLNEVKDNLDKAKAVVVLITPVSINRPWIWFEVGASWSRMIEGAGRIYPLCAPEIDFLDLPEPLGRLQALSLGKAEHVKLFFQTLCDQFGFGNMKGFKGSAITSRLPKYSDLKVDQSDLSTGTIYSGPYEGYSDEEFKEVLDEQYFYREKCKKDRHDSVNIFKSLNRDESLFMGKLVHYHEIDERFKLPPGTSKRFLKDVASRYELVPEQELENCIRFKLKR
ncbi:MAG: TIR domain-containing protein [Candidatus Brocadiales bacterium]